MAQSNVTVNFTDRTLRAIRERGLQILRDRIGQFAYNDAVATGVAPAMIDVVAWFHEQNAHYYDRRRRNSLLFLADTIESMRILTRAQGYRMRPATAASVSIQAQPSPPQPATITLPAGTRVVVGDLTFEMVNAAIIPSSVTAWPDGTTDDVIALTEGVSRVDRFVSDGTKFQRFTLSRPGTIDGSVSVAVLGETWEDVPSLVFVEGDQQGRDTFFGDATDSQEYTLALLNAIIDPNDDGLTVLVIPFGQDQSFAQIWQQVEEFTGAPREFLAFIDVDGVVRIRFGLAADGAAPALGDSIQVIYLISGAQKRYQLTYDEFDAGLIQFGDGIFGVIPPSGADVVVTYRIGGGVRGNVPPGTIDQTVQGILPSGAQTPVRLTNVERGSGGEPPQSVEEARFFAPRFAKSNERAVRQEDFVALANSYIDPVFGAPSHANAFLKQRSPELNTVCIAVWGRDQLGRVSTPGTPLKIGLKRYMDTRRTFTTAVEMKDGAIIFMDMDISILLVTGAVRQVVFPAVTAAIQAFFNSALVRPGVDLAIGGLFQVIEGVDGVDRSNIDTIIGSQLVQLSIGTGDGATQEFSGDFVLEEGTTIVGQSVVISDGAQQMVDNGDGEFTGDSDLGVLPGPGNQVTYTDGKFSATFASAPPLNAVIVAEAKLEVYFSNVESIGGSDGSVQVVDTASTFFPIVKRGPRGAWSGDQARVVDGAQVGATDQFRGTLPIGIIDNSPPIPRPLTFTDSSGVPQVVIDNGVGVLLDGATPVGTISYVTGAFNFTFLGAVALPVFATWSTDTVDIFIAEEFLPLEPGRLFFWGGFGKDGAQPGAELTAFDDGGGNMVGDTLAGGNVIYETGRVRFVWNTSPPPGIAGGVARFGRLLQDPDGVLTEFDFEVRTGANGTGVVADLSATTDDGEGRLRLALHELSVVGFSFDDAYDNWQGGLDGDGLDRENVNFISYSIGTGKLTFLNPPPVGVAATGTITAVPTASLIDGETFTLDDGVNPAATFEFDIPPNGVGGGNVVVDISAAVTAEDVRNVMIAAINGVAALGITAAPGVAVDQIALTNNSTGVSGNVVIADTVVDVGFVHTGMAGGAGLRKEFTVQVTNNANYMYSAFVYRVKDPTAPGLDKGLFADNGGRLWGDTANTFPTSRLDHLRGRLIATLSGAPIAVGRDQELTYDALTGVPPVRDVPVAGDQIAVAGRISLTEVAPEVEANA